MLRSIADYLAAFFQLPVELKQIDWRRLKARTKPATDFSPVQLCIEDVTEDCFLYDEVVSISINWIGTVEIDCVQAVGAKRFLQLF